MKKRILLLVSFILPLFLVRYFSQTCPSHTALAGGSPVNTVCAGGCTTLSANIVPVNATTNYSFQSLPYTGFPYTGGSTVIPSVDDIWSGVVNIGFNFCYFGNTFNQLLVGANGQITFSTALANQPELWQINNIMPNLINTPGNTINGTFRDIDPSMGGTVRVYTTGVAPCRKFVAYWLGVPLFGCAAAPASTFQIVLHETTNIIDVNVVNSSGACTHNNGRGLIGIQNNNATIGVAPPTRNNLTNWTGVTETWRFIPNGTPLYTINWSGPSFTATGQTATVCPTASGNYTAVMSVTPCSGPVINLTSTAQINVTPGPTVSAFNLTGTVCAGNPATLVATGALTYTWFPGSIVGNIITVTPTTSTTYTVVGSVGTCTGSATVTVPVSNGPTLSISATPTTVCSSSGNSATLTASGAVSYTWLPGPVFSNSYVITPTVSSTYTLFGANALGCITGTTVSFSVTPTPTLSLSASNSVICQGNSSTLTASGAQSYTWQPGSLTGSLQVVSPSSSTMYTVTGSNGTCTSSLTINITVNPSPTISASSSPTLLCSGNSSTLSASGASTYTWMPGSLTGGTVVVTPVTTTQYTVFGTSSLSCNASTIVTVSVNITPTLIPTASPATICLAGSSTLSASGASSYTWNPGSLIGASIVVTPTSTTIYTVTGVNGICSDTKTVSITVNPTPTVTASGTPTLICSGNSTTLSASGASSYTWFPGSLSGSLIVVSPSVTTNYTVVGSNGSCTASAVVSISVNASPTITAISNPTGICSGSGGTATITASGAASYTWIPGSIVSSSITTTPITTETYTVIGTAANGCTASTGATVFVVPVPTVVVNASPSVICQGNSSTLTATGALSYTWLPGSFSGSSISVNPASTTIYTVIGANGGCTDTKTVQVLVNPSPTITASASPTQVCSGSSVTLSATGGITYTWQPGSLSGTTVVVSPSVTTVYTVSGTNVSGCTGTAVVNVSVTPNPTVNPSASPSIICVGASSTLSATGASSYTWNPGSLTGASIVVTPTATTVYTVIGSNGACTDTKTVSITVNPNPTITASANPTIICAGNSSTLSASGALGYTWQPGSLSGSSVSVSPSVTTVYTVTGINASGCSSSATVQLNVNPNPTISATANPTNICSGTGATSTLSASGAVSYIWNPGSLFGANVVVTPTSSITYTVVGSSALGCLGIQTVAVLVTPTPTLSISATSTSICQGNTVTISAGGATTYTWNPGSLTTGTITVSPSSTTVYTVTGANGICQSTATISILVNPTPTVTAISNPTAICSGNTATLTASGASSYTWQPGSLSGSSQTVSPISTTIYTLTGANGTCISTTTVQLIVNPTPTVTISASTTSICSSSGSTVGLSASGALSYTWQPGNIVSSAITVTPASTTVYTVTGAGAGGCLGVQTVTIQVVPTPTVSVSSSASVICSGNSVTLSATGASGYTWNPGSLSGATIAVSPTSTAVYTVTGSNGSCSDTKTIQITVNPTPTLTASGTPTLKCSTQQATLSASGATGYTWMPGSLSGSSVVVSPSVTTTYTVTGSVGACSGTAVVTISVAPSPTINTFGPPAICSGSSATLLAIGASSYTWLPGSVVSQTIVVSPSVTTVYTVTGSNAFGCTGTATRTLNVIPSPTINPIATPTAICSGGSATLSVTGANNYTWLPGPTTGSTIVVSPSVSTTYTVTGNIGPCTDTKTLGLIVNPTPTLSAASSTNNVCAGTSITLSASGALSYTWQPGSLSGGTVVVSPLVSTNYTVFGSNASGCFTTAVVSVSVISGPSVSISASSTTICAGQTVTLTPSGASGYTLLPGSVSGISFAVTPTTTTTYTVIGDNGGPNSCPGIGTIQLVVNPAPSITISASPASGICIGETVTLTASGASSYTWSTLPPAVSSTVIDTPTVTTTYTVVGTNSLGCTSTQTITIGVTPVPTIQAFASSTLVCEGFPVTLVGIGATNYTWQPGSLNGGTVIVNPTITTTYTLFGDNGGCASNATVEITVTPGPQNVTASATGSITCTNFSVGLLGNTTSTNVSYYWEGPGSYTSSVQNPTPIMVGGNYTLTVTDLNTGCTKTVIAFVPTNTTVPDFTVTSSGDLGCNDSVTLSASSSATSGITYTWSGPATFTSALQSFTINIPGVYTVSAFDFATGCVSTLTIAVNSNTDLPVFTATILPATCNGTVSNNDGTILVSGNGVKYDYVTGTTYTGTADYTTATPIPTTGIITNTLVNPSSPVPYTIRIWGSNGCFKDTTLYLAAINCDNRIFGLTKAAGTPSLVNNKYHITYTVTAVNASNDNLQNVILNENLTSTFPLPTTYSIIVPPYISSLGSSLTINPLFDGNTVLSLTEPSTSTLLANKRDTIVFTVEITPNGFFGPFLNWVVGSAQDINSLTVADSSNDGFGWDPDQDGNPTNNNLPTVITLTPNSLIGVAKAGILSEKLPDNTYDITYIITVKNFGNDTLSNVQVRDSLAKTIPPPAQFSIKSGPVISGNFLTVNSGFNGSSDINLLNASLSKLPPGTTDTIRFTLNVKPDTVRVLVNVAKVSATNQFSVIIRNNSHNGYNSDPNNNGTPNESDESDPTIIVLPDTDFFIPQVFTPNGDGKNDFFVIKGLNGRKVKLTVFNRWGNKVYENNEYDNSWDGYPNVRTLVVGGDKLPQGTYYYVLEFKDDKKEVYTGYVVLQY